MIKVNSSGIYFEGLTRLVWQIGPLLVNFNPLFYAFTPDNLITFPCYFLQTGNKNVIRNCHFEAFLKAEKLFYIWGGEYYVVYSIVMEFITPNISRCRVIK